MCGVSGVISKTNIHIDSFVKMNQIIKYRGPDDEGFVFFDENKFQVCGSEDTATESWSSNELYSPKSEINSSKFQANVGFGHRRLSILDLSPKGHQPSCTKDERLWITFNGEIYNYIEIREELIKLGYTFSSDTDTEVILASYQEWGIQCQHRFNGMWAFAVYDRQEKLYFYLVIDLVSSPFIIGLALQAIFILPVKLSSLLSCLVGRRFLIKIER